MCFDPEIENQWLLLLSWNYCLVVRSLMQTSTYFGKAESLGLLHVLLQKTHSPLYCWNILKSLDETEINQDSHLLSSQEEEAVLTVCV